MAAPARSAYPPDEPETVSPAAIASRALATNSRSSSIWEPSDSPKKKPDVGGSSFVWIGFKPVEIVFRQLQVDTVEALGLPPGKWSSI